MTTSLATCQRPRTALVAQFTGRRRGPANREEGAHQKEVFHAFRAAPEEELQEEDLKVKKENMQVKQKTIEERTWYSQEAWEHGGLRIKDEVKEEEGAPKKKRVKKE